MYVFIFHHPFKDTISDMAMRTNRLKALGSVEPIANTVYSEYIEYSVRVQI
jgi:hypothetical protein